MVVDFAAWMYLFFCILNGSGLAVIMGFFTGTGTFSGTTSECIENVKYEASRCTLNHGGKVDKVAKELRNCLLKMDQHLLSNSDGHYFKVMLPFLLAAIFNILIFFSLFYMRHVVKVQFRRAKREEEKASSLPAQQQFPLRRDGWDKEEEPQQSDYNPFPDAGVQAQQMGLPMSPPVQKMGSGNSLGDSAEKPSYSRQPSGQSISSKVADPPYRVETPRMSSKQPIVAPEPPSDCSGWQPPEPAFCQSGSAI